MLSVIYSAGLFGLDGYTVTVECSAEYNLGSFEIVGLPDTAVKEAKHRVLTAMSSAGLPVPELSVVMNLAPADRRKEGSSYDLAMAAAVIAAVSDLGTSRFEDCCFIGELSLTGSVKPVRGVLPMTASAVKDGKTKIFVPPSCAAEASVQEGAQVFPVKDLDTLRRHMTGEKAILPVASYVRQFDEVPFSGCDMSDVRGQDKAKRAMEIAAAGGHNVLLIGPPGSGKSMLAKRLPTILPPITGEEALTATKIHSAAGTLPEGQPMIINRPFRSPHHTVSSAAMVGGGKIPAPGEISLANGGVLFLDEFPEFNKAVTESLRQPLEDKIVTVTRASGRADFPADFMLVCAMNPCRCGYFGSSVRKCTCKKDDIKKYLSRISGPLLDRIDIQVEMPSPQFSDLTQSDPGESSDTIRERVIIARERAARRMKEDGVLSNGAMESSHIRRYCKMDPKASKILEQSFDTMGISARGFDRILRVARTIADLGDSDVIQAGHMAEAVQLRSLDRKYWDR